MAQSDKDTPEESPADLLGAFLPMYWAADLCVKSLRLMVDTRDRVLGGKPSCDESDYEDFHLEGQANLSRLQGIVNCACWAVKGGIKLSAVTRAKLTEVSGKTVKSCGVLATNAHEAAITLGAYCLEQIARATGTLSQPIDPVRLREGITADNLVAACRSVGHLTSDVAELAVDIRREFILVGGDASMTDFTPGWIREPDDTPNVSVQETPEEETATSGKPSHVVQWQNDTYYYIYQTFFDQGRVFARLKGFTLVEASKICSALTVVRPQGDCSGLIRMVSWRSPHRHLPTAAELESGKRNASGDLVISYKGSLGIGLPIPKGDFAARIWLRKEWSRFKKRLLDKEIERDDIDCYMVRLHRLFRKLRKEVLAEPLPEPADAQTDNATEEELGQVVKSDALRQFPSILPASVKGGGKA